MATIIEFNGGDRPPINDDPDLSQLFELLSSSFRRFADHAAGNAERKLELACAVAGFVCSLTE